MVPIDANIGILVATKSGCCQGSIQVRSEHHKGVKQQQQKEQDFHVHVLLAQAPNSMSSHANLSRNTSTSGFVFMDSG